MLSLPEIAIIIGLLADDLDQNAEAGWTPTASAELATLLNRCVRDIREYHRATN